MKTYFMEKIQIMLSSKSSIEILNNSDPGQGKEKKNYVASDEKISLDTKKELRAKKVEYNFKVSNTNDEALKQKSITEIMDKHQKVHASISSHLKKEIDTQENEFEKKMEKRRERSVSRSMNKSSDIKSKRGEDFKCEEGHQSSSILHQLRAGDKKKSQILENPFKTDF